MLYCHRLIGFNTQFNTFARNVKLYLTHTKTVTLRHTLVKMSDYGKENENGVFFRRIMSLVISNADERCHG